MKTDNPASCAVESAAAGSRRDLPGQVVLVLQGGGALGAFQVGVYEAMHEAGIEPDWVVGTSIGAINGAIIAGNAPGERLPRLREFWARAAGGATSAPFAALDPGGVFSRLGTLLHGIPGFFAPNPESWLGACAPLGVAGASFYTTAPLRRTLAELVDFGRIAGGGTRLTLGAVNARSGRMRYFDSRDEPLAPDHVLASGALPPAFPAVLIDGEPYWDGGVYSNTPIEVVMDDAPRRDSLIFATQLWQQEQDDDDPASIQQVLSRLKDIQYSSRHRSHVARQQQIHRLRHIVRELGKRLPAEERARPEVRELMSWGCGTVMHVLSLRAPRLDGEDGSKDIDFTAAGIRARWDAGYRQARERIAEAPWEDAFDPVVGVVLHE
ncbi:patatin-like phospholipase family protein [Azospira restricta]|uniref:Patatin-like phospholipase family protein n=1 Tax=Azospira restricta TaxID=404405 RepID=A0A974PWW6_9RHOO|nr:patatin-like phospholipase family protein [Azospira restricta]QRJ62628.1 patatin-like phospholipase family protein [Azospira restricta]